MPAANPAVVSLRQSPDGWLITAAGVPDLTAPDAATAVDQAVSAVNIVAIAADEGALMLHTGGVVAPDGGVVLLCGRAGSGKSTLTVRLVQRGWGFLSDELVTLDPTSYDVSCYEKPVTLKPGSQRLLPELDPGPPPYPAAPGHNWQVPADRIRSGATATAPGRPRHVVIPRWEPRDDVAVTTVSRARMAAHLGEQSSRLHAVPGRPLEVLAGLVTSCSLHVVRYGDSRAAADAVADLVAA